VQVSESVQTLLSSQLVLSGSGTPPTHEPSVQVPPARQPPALPQLVPLATGAPEQPPRASQLSLSVHSLPSSQSSFGVITFEQASPSSSQLSVVHGLLSLQFASPSQLPSIVHASAMVQKNASVQGLSSRISLRQPRATSQLSAVHSLPSLQSTGSEPMHAPPALQVLVSVQAF